MATHNYKYIFEPIESIENKTFTDKKIQKLKSLGIERIYDLLYFFPRAYDDRTNIVRISDLRGGEYAVVRGEIIKVSAPPTRSRLKMVKAQISDGIGAMEIVWFGLPFLRYSLKVGEEYIFIGEIKPSYPLQMTNPEFKLAEATTDIGIGEILPIYRANKYVTQKELRKIISDIIATYLPLIDENIPEEILDKYDLMPRRIALKEIHNPTSTDNYKLAKKRFAFEELFVLEMGILSSRYALDKLNTNKYIMLDKKEMVKKYISSLPFELTSAQKHVITEIYKELSSGKIVNRLLQGDVGSGKTVVATILLLYMIENGYQGAFMAPTEILASQHYESLSALSSLGVRVALLTGSLKEKEKRELLASIQSGEINLVIGTHAIIEDNVEFANLGLIVIDEQHRFGVMQRKALRDKGVLANLIVMSATPIPRSLALSIYGDLDVSIIDAMPIGRKIIKTKWIYETTDLKKMYMFINKKISEGKQAYFVAPLIDESGNERSPLTSVKELQEEVATYLPNARIGVLHGRMKSADKDKVMTDFKSHNLDVLVATTVVEVGVNVPNATTMVITNADRFGLSSLHQLRGRVGRGDDQSYCFLVSYTNNEISERRLRVMESTTDGFKIAEEDLKLRKPGEIYGTKQSGISDLKLVDISLDIKTIELVKSACTEYLDAHNGIIDNNNLVIDMTLKFSKE